MEHLDNELVTNEHIARFLREYRVKNGHVKLNIGCGDVRMDGYINIDIKPSDSVDVLADINNLPFPDNSCTEVFMRSVIEFIYPREIFSTMDSLFRVLRPGGQLILMVVPDFRQSVKAFMSNRDPKQDNNDAELMRSMIFTHGVESIDENIDEESFALIRKTIFDSETIAEIVTETGFEKVTIHEHSSIDQQLDKLINVFAWKPASND